MTTISRSDQRRYVRLAGTLDGTAGADRDAAGAARLPAGALQDVMAAAISSGIAAGCEAALSLRSRRRPPCPRRHSLGAWMAPAARSSSITGPTRFTG
jgi:hypothetical protein